MVMERTESGGSRHAATWESLQGARAHDKVHRGTCIITEFDNIHNKN